MTGKRVLVVEDNALVALDIAELLLEAGYGVVGPADRLTPALHLAETAAFDAALLDVDLAGVKVWPVAEVLARRGIPFLLLTGFDGGFVAPPAFAQAPRLPKPFGPAPLLQEVAALLQAG